MTTLRIHVAAPIVLETVLEPQEEPTNLLCINVNVKMEAADVRGRAQEIDLLAAAEGWRRAWDRWVPPPVWTSCNVHGFRARALYLLHRVFPSLDSLLQIVQSL